MRTVEEKRETVQASLLKRRASLVKQGLCRDCGLNPIAAQVGKRRPTLCATCRADRRDREIERRQKRRRLDVADFATCYDFVLANEDYTPPRYATVPDPTRSDPLALAISGINSAEFPEQFEVIFAAATPVERAPLVADFYRKTYFTAELAQLSNPVAMRLMDAEVNEGAGAGVKLLQKACLALGATLEVDGALGPLTIAAANACDQDALVAAFKAARVAAYEAIGGPDLAEWIARANK